MFLLGTKDHSIFEEEVKHRILGYIVAKEKEMMSFSLTPWAGAEVQESYIEGSDGSGGVSFDQLNLSRGLAVQILAFRGKSSTWNH